MEKDFFGDLQKCSLPIPPPSLPEFLPLSHIYQGVSSCISSYLTDPVTLSFGLYHQHFFRIPSIIYARFVGICDIVFLWVKWYGYHWSDSIIIILWGFYFFSARVFLFFFSVTCSLYYFRSYFWFILMKLEDYLWFLLSNTRYLNR